MYTPPSDRHVLQADNRQNAYHELTGYPRDPALNEQYTFLDYCHPDDVELAKEKWKVLSGGTATTFEMRWKNDTPTGQWVLAAVTPVFDDAGNLISVSGCTTDIAAQKRAQEDALQRAEALEQVRISQARLLQFTDNAPIGIVILEPSGKPLYINRSWFSITDHPETLASEVDIMSVCYPDDLTRIKRKQEEAITQKKTVEFRARLKKKWTCVDGSFNGQAWVAIMYLPEFDDDGVLIRVMSTCTDISHSQFSEHLQRKRLEEAIEAKRRTEAFIDTVSHEIRNPLGATVHCADFLQDCFVEMRKLVDTLAEDCKSDKSQQSTIVRLEEQLTSGIDAVETILSCSMHQKRVTDDILSLSKLDSNLLQVAPSTVRATEMLDNVSNFFAVEAGREKIVLRTQMDDSLKECNVEWVVVDPGRVTQVLVNLVTNALKFTKTSKNKREIVVRLGASKGQPSNLSIKYAAVENPEVTVQTELGIDAMVYLWFTVTDSGCGMTEEEQTRMFNRFSQASPKTYNRYGGSGLGLFISKRLVELQGGQIGLASQVDIGSKFAFYVLARQTTRSIDSTDPELPIRTKTKALLSTAAGAPTLSVSSTASDYSILVVEDNKVNQKVLQKQLTKLGYEVQIANHGQEALDYLTTTSAWRHKDGVKTTPLPHVDVILMDIEMPVMDGLTCSKKIRELQSSEDIVKHVPIIAVSANARAEQMKQAVDAGVDGFITKPFRMPELTAVISKLLGTA
jgi:signal transduction histidine kinase/FixJ family two-component response regulator